MPDRTTPQKFTAPVRRGFGTLLAYLQEDIDVGLFSPDHPLHRRLKTPAMHNAMAALRYLEQHYREQQKWDEARSSTRKPQEGDQ
jgi:hypothetical protein